MKLAELKEKRAGVVERMDAIMNKTGDITDAEASEFDRLDKEQASLKAAIDRVEKCDALKSEIEEVEESVVRRAESKLPRQRPGGEVAKKEFETFGHFLEAAMFGGSDQRLEYHEGGVLPSGHRRQAGYKIPEKFAQRIRPSSQGLQAADTQEMGTGELGGFAVPTQRREGMLSLPFPAAVVRPRAMVIPAGTPPDSAIEMPALKQDSTENIYAGVELTWTAEGAAKTQTDAHLQLVKLEPKEISGKIEVTDKLLRNFPAASALLESLFRGAGVHAEEVAFISGSGVGKPLGFTNALNASAIAINRATGSDVTYADVVGMEARLFGGAGVWLANRTVLPKLRQMEDTEGHLVWQESARVGEPASLLGKPIVFNERLAALGSKGDLCLVDLSYYLIKDGSGPFVAASEHEKFSQNKTVVKFFFNVDGQPWLKSPVPVTNGDTLSPFVLLDVPA